MNDWYAANARDKGIATHCFYESERTPVPLTPKGLIIVEKDSGDIDVPDIPSYAMTADHIQLCKPADPGDSRVGYLNQVVLDVLSPASDMSETSEPTPGVLPPAHGKFIGRNNDLKDIRGALLVVVLW